MEPPLPDGNIALGRRYCDDALGFSPESQTLELLEHIISSMSTRNSDDGNIGFGSL